MIFWIDQDQSNVVVLTSVFICFSTGLHSDPRRICELLRWERRVWKERTNRQNVTSSRFFRCRQTFLPRDTHLSWSGSSSDCHFCSFWKGTTITPIRTSGCSSSCTVSWDDESWKRCDQSQLLLELFDLLDSFVSSLWLTCVSNTKGGKKMNPNRKIEER